ncbi:MAG: DUF3124 domain-containing protein [Draconibacterium sp.]|nr:DUF3124 domain-containing protein [Draconibacterium sp.]
MKAIFILLFIIIFIGCKTEEKKAISGKKRSHPSHVYTYIDIDSVKLKYFETDYLPVYSDIYHQDGTKRFPITATVSIRNTSLTDSAYIQSATYHDSFAKLLRSYLDSTLLLLPMESVEFVVEEGEKAGGAGANFIIEWAATNYSDQILIQSIMIGTYGQQGISFLTEAKVIKSTKKE